MIRYPPIANLLQELPLLDSEINHEAEDVLLSMMECRPWKRRVNHQLPLRFRDLLPQALPFLPPPACNMSPTPPPFAMPPSPQNAPPVVNTSSPASLANTSTLPHSPQLHRIFTTQRNTFGLSRTYDESTHQPLHDPEEHHDINDLSDISNDSNSSDSFSPYPNASSFLLGEWYWNT